MFAKMWFVIIAVQVVMVSIGGVIGEIFSCERFGLKGWGIVILAALTMYPVDLLRKLIFGTHKKEAM